MTGVNTWDIVAANNVLANIGYTWDEGMAPGAVNNSARAVLADVRSMANDLIWFQYGKGAGPYTPVYVGATQYKIAGVDVSAAYHVGRRTKVTGSSTGTITGTINTVAFSTDTTVTVTWDSGSLSNEVFTAVYLCQLPVTGVATGTGKVVLATSPTITGATLTGATGTFTGAVTPSSTNGIVGTTTNDSPNAGAVGEVISATASAVSLTTGTDKTITSISLTAGDWDVWFRAQINPAGTTTGNRVFCSISQTNNTVDASTFDLFTDWSFLGAAIGAANWAFCVGPTQIKLASTTTIYGVISAGFGTSTMTGSGKLIARRRR